MTTKAFDKIEAGLREAIETTRRCGEVTNAEGFRDEWELESKMSQMDSYGRHEVLHMAAYFEHAIGEELGEHEQIKTNPELAALVERAQDALMELYRAIGFGHDDDR